MRLVRLLALLLALFTAVLLITINVVRALNPDPACLVMENYQRVTIDPYSDSSFEDYQMAKAFRAPQAANLSPLGNGITAVSSDRQYYAVINKEHPDQIEVKRYNARPLLYNLRSEAFLSDGFIQWSPDGQRIAFVEDQKTLRIADVQGKVLRSIQAPAEAATFYLDSWSADSRYLAVLMQTEDSLRLQLIDADTLSPVMSTPQPVGTGCVSPGDGNILCYPWAASGAHAHYIEDGPPKPQSTNRDGKLVLVNTGQIVQTFALPETDFRSLASSADGSLVAVVSFPTTMGASYVESIQGRLDIYGEDGTAITQIDRVAYAGLGMADGTPFAEMYWSPDNRSLMYFRQDTATMQLMRYDLQSRTKQTLLTVPSDAYFGVSFSTDGKLLAVWSLFNPTVSANGPNAWLIRLRDGHTIPFNTSAQEWNSFAWKGDLLAYPVWDTAQQSTAINMVDGNGTLLRSYPLPNGPLDTLYWNNCQD